MLTKDAPSVDDGLIDKAVYTDGLGKLIDLKCAEQCPQGYPMEIDSLHEWSAIAEAVGEGLDEYGEAITNRSCFDEGDCIIHPCELKTLVRRLMIGTIDTTESVLEAGQNLAMGICFTLDIELD